MRINRQHLRSQIEREVRSQLTTKEINEVAKELYPYFKEAILEERATLRAYMLVEGHFDLYESMLHEEELLNEGILDTVADIGITAGQMIGGGVGQAAGIAGLVKYTPEFQNNINKGFLDWFFPFISVFFSAQALLFPMPAVASLKGILTGFAKGVKNVISGAGGMLAKGVTMALSKGASFFTKIIGLFKKAIAGIIKAVSKGGPTVAKIEGKVGSSMLSKAMKSLKTAGDEFVKRLGVLIEGLKNLGKTNIKDAPGMVKDILVSAFKTSKDKLGQAAKSVKSAAKSGVKSAKSGAGAAGGQAIARFESGIMKASQAGREALSKWIRSYMSKNVDKMNKLLKPLYGRTYGEMGEFVGLTTGGAFKFAAKGADASLDGARSVMTVSRSGQKGSVYIDKILNQKMAGNLLRDLAQIKQPLIDIMLKAFAPLMPRVAKELARAGVAAGGGGYTEEYMDDYLAGKTHSAKEIEKIKKAASKKRWSGSTNESRYLEELIWESNLRRNMVKRQKLINLIN